MKTVTELIGTLVISWLSTLFTFEIGLTLLSVWCVFLGYQVVTADYFIKWAWGGGRDRRVMVYMLASLVGVIVATGLVRFSEWQHARLNQNNDKAQPNPSPLSTGPPTVAAPTTPKVEPPALRETDEPIPTVKPIPHKAKSPVTKKDVPIKPKEIVPNKSIETAQIEAAPIQPKERLAGVLIRKYPQNDPALERLPKGFIQEWLTVIHTVNDSMTKHDLRTVLQIRPKLRDGISDTSHLAEAIFTLRCLESEGYVRIAETSDRIQGFPGVVNNLEFEFAPEKLNEFMEGL